MRTLFSRILLAQVVVVVLALVVVTLITRASLTGGFRTFLELQEDAVLQSVAPVLTEVYVQRGGWAFLRQNPQNWQRIWRFAREREAGGHRPGRGRMREGAGPLSAPNAEVPRRWPHGAERGMLRERLFLLDENRVHLAGAQSDTVQGIRLQELIVEEQTVGWIGFVPMGDILPPEASRFLSGQLKITAIALVAALIVAAALAWLLARNVSRPVQRLGRTIRLLSDGDYSARAGQPGHDEIGMLARHVNQLADSLDQSRTARRRWMADIAHELRTPVAVLKGEIEALADGVRQANAPVLASLSEEVSHLASLVDDLQALALADAGALNLVKEPFDLSPLVGQCAEAFRNRLARREIRLETDLAPAVSIVADPHRIRQLLHNLLENSARYADGGGRVRLSLSTGQAIQICLEDSGPGVSEEQLEKVFHRFYRVEGSRSRSTGGSGLGLSICKSIVEAHGGQIDAGRSSLGGLLIRIELPSRGGAG